MFGTTTLKHIVLTSLHEFGGSNSYLKELIKYLGPGNVVLVLTDKNQLQYLNGLGDLEGLIIEILPRLLAYADIKGRPRAALKMLSKMVFSLIIFIALVIKHRCKTVNISSVEPEKHLYFLWLPFVPVFYTLHSTAGAVRNSFSTITCNLKLNPKKQIITVSNSNKQSICQNWLINKEKRKFVQVVYNCVSEGQNAQLRSFADNSKKLVLTLGHVVEYKNPAVWLEVAKLVTSRELDVEFQWLGNGPLFEEFKEKAKRLNNISFKGFIADPSSSYTNAWLYYQPSLYETQGIAVIEAMSNNLPCVVADVGGLPESVQNEFNGILVNPIDVEQNACAILKLIDSPQLRQEYGQRGYEKYQELFTFSAFKKRMNNIYNV